MWVLWSTWVTHHKKIWLMICYSFSGSTEAWFKWFWFKLSINIWHELIEMHELFHTYWWHLFSIWFWLLCMKGPLPKESCTKTFSSLGCDLCLKVFDDTDVLSAHESSCRLDPAIIPVSKFIFSVKLLPVLLLLLRLPWHSVWRFLIFNHFLLKGNSCNAFFGNMWYGSL